MEKVEIEFRYSDKREKNDECSQVSSFFMVGLYETIEDAVRAGNEALGILSKKGFELRANDIFKADGLFGHPDRLVSNACYKDKITFFAKITNVWSGNLDNAIDETFKARCRFDTFKGLKCT